MMADFVDKELYPRMEAALSLAHACGDLKTQDEMFREHRKGKEYVRELKEV